MMKKSLRKDKSRMLFGIVVLFTIFVSLETGVFHDVTSWLGAKVVESLNLR